jgi:hypothetical protein
LAIFHRTNTENKFCVLSNISKMANFCDVMPCTNDSEQPDASIFKKTLKTQTIQLKAFFKV